LGWEISESGLPKLISFHNHKVFIHSGNYKGQSGVVTFETDSRDRRTHNRNNAVDKAISVKLNNGESVKLSTLDVVLLNEEEIKRRIDPLTKAAIKYVPGMDVVCLISNNGFQVGDRFRITEITNSEVVFYPKIPGTTFHMKRLNGDQEVGDLYNGNSLQMIPAIYY
jgi:hypothetical protein